jgi:hypothetical protein
MGQHIEVGLVTPFLLGVDLANVIVPYNARGNFGDLDLGEVDSRAGCITEAKLDTFRLVHDFKSSRNDDKGNPQASSNDPAQRQLSHPATAPG